MSPQPASKPSARNPAIDCYRGFVMLLMMAEVLRLSRVAAAYPGNWFWGALAWNQTHVEWAGCSLHDLIQPSFSFLVGMALPYSIASRTGRGESPANFWIHALWRSLILVLLGVFLRSVDRPQTYFTFEDTLSQIGLGYPLLVLIGFRSPRWQWWMLGALLFAYWAAWALYPSDPASWPFHGFAAHWNKHANLGNAFDQWFLNLFPREKPFVNNGGGYLTLSFLPTLGTMMLGLVAGRWSRESAPEVPVKRFLLAAAIGIAAGVLLHFSGICPVVKRIWTPSWTLFSGGMCFLLLLLFGWISARLRRGAYVLMVVGANSIAAYLMAHLFERFFIGSLHTHLGVRPFQVFGTGLEPLLLGGTVLLLFWLLLWWMYRRKIFLRI